jgi:phosphate transport system permease protein
MKAYTRRKIKNHFMRGLLVLSAFAAVFPLVCVFVYVLKRGLPALNLSFFTELPKPVGEDGGGIANALIGSATMVFLAALIGVPFGIAAGTFLSEYGKSRLSTTLKFSIDLMTSVPSIIVGIFIYALVVMPMHGFSAYAGALALAFIMIPNIAKSTEEILKLVPQNIREAGLALGISRWKVTLFIVLRGYRKGLITGIILAVARVSGETAPLLLTAFGNRNFAHSLGQPTSSLPVQIYTFAISPYEDWHRQAWAGALVLVLFVLSINVITRVVFTRGSDA